VTIFPELLLNVQIVIYSTGTKYRKRYIRICIAEHLAERRCKLPGEFAMEWLAPTT
jgi:hypothetical protein